MATLSERLRDRAARMATKGNADALNDAADEIDRLTAENAALREERDALAATVDALKRWIVTNALPASADPIWNTLRSAADCAAILAAIKAKAKKEALTDAAEKFHCEAKAGRRNDAFLSANQCSESMYHTTELRRMADAIKKEAGNG